MRQNLRGTLCGVLLLTACSGDRGAMALAKTMPADAAELPVAPAPAAAEMAAVNVADRARGVAASVVPEAPAMERMIVRNASLTLQVANVRQTLDAVSRATTDAKGFLGTSRLWRDGEHERASLTVRVPAASLDATLATLRGLAVRVDDESVSGEDVTRQAVDLRAQLVNLRATEVELRALLTTVRQNAKKAAEVLEVHAELTRVRGEIERADDELQQLTQLAALSTISLELRPDVVTTPIATDTWQPRGVLRDATRALVSTLRVGVDAAIWAAVYLLPLVLLLAVPAGLVWRTVRRRGRTQVA